MKCSDENRVCVGRRVARLHGQGRLRAQRHSGKQEGQQPHKPRLDSSVKCIFGYAVEAGPGHFVYVEAKVDNNDRAGLDDI
jgi:hypothetical protein